MGCCCFSWGLLSVVCCGFWGLLCPFLLLQQLFCLGFPGGQEMLLNLGFNIAIATHSFKMNSSTSDALFDDACAYDNAVKSTCQEKYSEFAEVTSDYRDGRIDPGGVKARVHELFKGHRHLILGINNIMPKNYEIILPPSDDKLNRQDATTFLKQVKVVFQDKMEKYY
ncbi:paired amphipathic helix protein [Medicago truncatula]|uniref:Paired amphipathic helix protein n=2 Tax=Medicago truncatula TaxID=3880 RepID=G7IRZ0_MEDTR|nr:paired amphipathic helix protein [Medicago truncatula]